MRFAARFSFFLAPTVIGGAMTMAMIPVTTSVLGPAEFGVFAVMVPIATLGVAVAAGGPASVYPPYFPACAAKDRPTMVLTTLVMALLMAGAFCAAWLLVWRYAGLGFATVPTSGVLLTLAAVVLGVPWMIAQQVVVLDGRARAYAVVAVGQVVTNAAVTTVGLFVWNLGVTALFLSQAAAALVGFGASLVFLRRYLAGSVSRYWAMKVLALTPAGLGARLADALQVVVERGLMASYLGLGQLGLYAHAQGYRTVVASAVKGVALAIWPTTLMEARRDDPAFAETRAVWNVAYVAVTAVGLLFATLGEPLVAAITHGRFTEAHAVIPLLMVHVLMQNSGKPQTGTLVAAGGMAAFLWLGTGSSLAWVAVFAIIVPGLGLPGAVLALIGQQVLIRIGITVLARRHRRTPLQDGWVFGGGVAVLGTWWATERWRPDLGGRMALLALALSLLMIWAWRPLVLFAGRRGEVAPTGRPAETRP